METIGDQARPPVVDVVARVELVVAVNVVKPRERHHRSEGLAHGVIAHEDVIAITKE